MRVLIAVMIGMLLLISRGFAQESGVTEAVSSLQSVLSNLKDSVERLSVDNDQMTQRDNAIKAQVEQLQAQLGQLEDQGDQLSHEMDKLHGKDPGHAQQVARLEEQNTDLDDQRQKAQTKIRLAQESLNEGYQEDQRLVLQLSGVPSALLLQSPAYQLEVRRQKRKLQLMKMIAESQQRQADLQRAILKYQKNISAPPADALARQELLKEQIKILEGQLTMNPPRLPAVSIAPVLDADHVQLYQLEDELKVLEQNYAQLKELTLQMSQKSKSLHLTVSQHSEEKKLQGSLDDIVRQGEELKAQLDALRLQMVDLDKRKFNLESMIQHKS